MKTERGRDHRCAQLGAGLGRRRVVHAAAHRYRVRRSERLRGRRWGSERERALAADDERSLPALVGEHVVGDGVEVVGVELAPHEARSDPRDPTDARILRRPGDRVGERGLHFTRERTGLRERLIDRLEHRDGERALHRLHQARPRERAEAR